MKILAIGDFHGEFPKKFERIIKKEKIDIILSNGDYPPFSLGKLYFKEIFAKQGTKDEKKLWDIIGKERYKKITLKDFKKGETVLKKLNSLELPVFTVLGNHDYPPDDLRDFSKKEKGWEWKWENQLSFFPKAIKKYRNIQRVDYSYGRFGEYIIIGARGHSAPGRVKSRAYRRYKRKLDNLFKRFKEENKDKKVIFLTHNVPYKTKLDLLGKKTHELVRGRHAGSKMFRRIIEKYQPILHVGGHIGERMGKDKIGKTILINPGEAHHGKAVIIEIDGGKVRRVRFVH